MQCHDLIPSWLYCTLNPVLNRQNPSRFLEGVTESDRSSRLPSTSIYTYAFPHPIFIFPLHMSPNDPSTCFSSEHSYIIMPLPISYLCQLAGCVALCYYMVSPRNRSQATRWARYVYELSTCMDGWPGVRHDGIVNQIIYLFYILSGSIRSLAHLQWFCTIFLLHIFFFSYHICVTFLYDRTSDQHSRIPKIANKSWTKVVLGSY